VILFKFYLIDYTNFDGRSSRSGSFFGFIAFKRESSESYPS